MPPVWVAVCRLLGMALQPVQEPQPPLRIGQRDLGRTRLPGERRPQRLRLRRLQPGRERQHARRLKQAADRHLDVQRRTDPADQTRRQQRVTAELEEVVVDADPLDAQHLGKQRTQDRLLRAARRAVLMRRGKLRLRQRATVELAVRRQRQPLQHHERRRHHVVRQAPPQRRPQRRRIKRRTRRRHHVADSRGWPAPSCRAITTACDTPACRSSTASISPGSIRNPRSFTCASARPRNSSTPSDRHRARSPVRYIRLPASPCRRTMRVGDEPLRRQARALQIPPRQTHARDVQLADNARRHRLKTSSPEHTPACSRSDGRSAPRREWSPAQAQRVTSIEASVGPYRFSS